MNVVARAAVRKGASENSSRSIHLDLAFILLL
jgi:hypothetical protein